MNNSSAYLIPGILRIKTPMEILEKILSEDYNMSLEYVNTKTRARDVVLYRQVIHTILCRHTTMSQQSIGISIGRKNHCTVIHSRKQIENAEYMFSKRHVLHPILELYRDMETKYLEHATSKEMNI